MEGSDEYINFVLKPERDFIVKVYMILAVCMATTIGIVSFIYWYNPDKSIILVVVALIFFIIAIYQLAFNGQANIYPMNFALLFVFVLATSYITGYIA